MTQRSALPFRIESHKDGGRLVLCVFGVIDERADLGRLATADAPLIWLHLEHVSRINSFGVRSWIDAVRRISNQCRLVFSHCSPPIVDQCNMVAGFLGHGSIESFYAPMMCDTCGGEEKTLFKTKDCLALGGVLPEVRCSHCSGSMDIDDLEEQYLMFMHSEAG
ncbi:MAG: hypothetical protein MJE77_31740 [Proteobacteria bacterium]|nr:hypothetical protein [Pseudomonadota bacterium]